MARQASLARCCPGSFVLRGRHTAALIRPLLPTDAETLRDVFRRLSPIALSPVPPYTRSKR